MNQPVNSKPCLIAYQDVATDIPDGAILLKRVRWRPSSLLIARAGRTIYCHAAMVASWGRSLMVLETQAVGGRAITLESQVRRYSGLLDVYQVNSEQFRPDDAVHYMRERCGQVYGWLSLLKAAMLHLPLIRLFVRPNLSDQPNGTVPYCSALVAAACLYAGVDLVPRLANRLTEPGDLGRSSDLNYCYTLKWDEQEASKP